LMDLVEFFFKLKDISWTLSSRLESTRNRTRHKMGDAGK
jgi:hypothetical protein